jgi:hypothetical protein
VFRTQQLVSPALTTVLMMVGAAAYAQQRSDSSAATPDTASADTAARPWRKKIYYGGGPSVGTPISDYRGATPPSQWCLQAGRRAPGDLGGTGSTWTEVSRAWLHRVLSDTTQWGAGWRKVLGDIPPLAPSDSIFQVMDESACRDIAAIIHREFLQWKVGPPPVVVFRLHDNLLAFPSNAPLGEFGLAVGMNLKHEIRSAAMW